MSTINVSNLILTLQQKIDSSSSESDILYYSKAMQQLRSGIVFSVNTFSDLPNLALNIGLLYYVTNEETVYFSSSFGWVPLYVSPISPMFVWGRNSGGNLGDGTTTDSCSPVREFCSATDWCQVDRGCCNAAAIKTTGELWAWGNNSCGLLGDGTGISRCSPVREFCSATDWCQVGAGYRSAGAVKTSGQIWTWGINCGGQLGDGTTVSRCSPIREFCSATDWCGLSRGSGSTAAIKTSGQIWTWGYNFCGRLGDGTINNRCSPVREFCSATDWCQVTAGRIHVAAIKTSGQLWAWGTGTCGRLGDGTTVSRCSPVREFCSATNWCQATGYNHTSAIKTTGELWAWGSNACGVLGDGTTVVRCSPVREFCSATDWCQVSSRGERAVAIKTSGQLWAWGNNSLGQLGDGTTVTTCSPVREFCSATSWCQASTMGCGSAAIQLRNL